MSLSDWPSLHLRQSSFFSFAERPGRPVRAMSRVYHVRVALTA
jgi:hypothetical protein